MCRLSEHVKVQREVAFCSLHTLTVLDYTRKDALNVSMSPRSVALLSSKVHLRYQNTRLCAALNQDLQKPAQEHVIWCCQKRNGEGPYGPSSLLVSTCVFVKM